MNSARSWLLLGLACGALPLMAGVAVFLLWSVTRWRILPLAGIGVIGLGLLLFLPGLFSVPRYLAAARSSENPRPRAALHATLMVALLLLNFPAAAGLTWAAVFLETRSSVTVVNASGGALEDIRLDGGGVHVPFGTIPPGGRATRRFHVQTDGSLTLRGRRNDVEFVEVVESYVTNGQGGLWRVTVGAEGAPTVEERY